MIKIAKYLKPFIGLILAAIILLFVQAMADLSLPDYMSDIVNNGIQQGDIENSVPEAMRKNRMDKIALFMSENDKKEVLKYYNLIDKSSTDYDKYLKQYPALEKELVYVLKDISDDEISKINPVMGKGILDISGIEKMKDGAKDGIIKFNGREIPSDTDLFKLFESLPREQRLQISNEMNKKFTALGDGMIVQEQL